MQRSSLVEFLKEKLPSNLMQYNKTISKVYSNTENIKLTFKDQSSAIFDYLVVSDGIFSSTKSLILNKYIRPNYFKAIAIRGTLNKKDLNSIDFNNISLFLGSNFHSVIYPVNRDNELNFIGILRKNLSKHQLEDHLLFDNKNFLSSILSNLSNQIDQNILNNLKNIKCFPIFTSQEIYKPKQKNIFLIGDAFFTFPPTFAQGASQSIEAAFELYESLKNGNNEFTSKRIERTKMINKKSKFNYFVFHLSNPFMTFARDLTMRYLIKNKKFIDSYLGKVYKN